MSTPIEVLVERLEAVLQRRAGQWMARCPAHDDNRPSLLIDSGEDERVLVHCFAGCSALDVVHAVGLELRDLFPQRLPDQYGRYPRRRPTLSACDVIDILDHERLVVLVVAHGVLSGSSPSRTDLERLSDAGHRIERLREILK